MTLRQRSWRAWERAERGHVAMMLRRLDETIALVDAIERACGYRQELVREWWCLMDGRPPYSWLGGLSAERREALEAAPPVRVRVIDGVMVPIEEEAR